MLRVTLDTNIYISAFQFGGSPMRLLRQGLESEIDIAISQPIIDETLRVLRDKFHWQPYEIHEVGKRMEQIGHIVAPTETLNVIEYDPPDNRILECAKTAGSEFILSHDKDLLRLGEYEGIKIVRVADFLAIQRSGGSNI